MSNTKASALKSLNNKSTVLLQNTMGYGGGGGEASPKPPKRNEDFLMRTDGTFLPTHEEEIRNKYKNPTYTIYNLSDNYHVM